MLLLIISLCFTVNNNIDMHTVACNAIDEPECIIETTENFQTLPTEIINIEELTKQNDKFDKNINTELLRNESNSNVMLPEYNLYKNKLNQSETNTNNSTLDCNFDQTVMFLFEELHDLDISLNNILNHWNIDENNVINNNLDKCYSNNGSNISDNDNNIETEDNNRDKVNNNSMNIAKLIQNTNKNLKQFCKTPSNINDSFIRNNSDCDNIDKICPGYCYSNSKDSIEENISVQSYPTEFNNIIKNSLETSLNIFGQKICDDTNLHVKYSNLRGTGERNFCYYCKKMQSKISRHLERIHKDEEEVKKFTALPKGIENMLLKYIFLIY